MAEQALIELKTRWVNDTLPGTDIKIGNAMVGMQDITIEEIVQLSQITMQAETYTAENAGAFQHILITKEDGSFDFDFEKLDKIAKLARKNGKKIIIDSAVVFGDHFPYKIANLDKETISILIGEYAKKLASRYGDIIERIDVFNAIFERKQISEGNNSEDFWIKTFGENYAQEIIDIVRANIDFNKYSIKLGWNEFYLTNSNYRKRKDDFLERIKSMRGLDVVGIQDRFMSGENIDYIIHTLDEISSVCKEGNKVDYKQKHLKQYPFKPKINKNSKVMAYHKNLCNNFSLRETSISSNGNKINFSIKNKSN
jgi:GH35 family endo-1,4-beta-xylanase